MASFQRLSNADFLTQLSSLLSTTHAANHGSVFLTQKPLFPDTSSPDAAEEQTSSDDQPSGQTAPQILVRATNGKSTQKPSGRSGVQKKKTAASAKGKSDDKKIKFSTVVDVSEAEDFFARYADVCKAGMQGLRKRDRKKGKKKAKGAKK